MRYDPTDRFSVPDDYADCETLAPFVMALFDGEADELEAQRARAHLIVCQNCARRWLDWTTSRDLLRSVAVPAPPPTLLWRVLMACRLAAFTKRQKAPQPHSQLSAQILARTTRASATPAVTSRVQRKRPVLLQLGVPSLAVPAIAMWLLLLQGDSLLPPVAEMETTPLSTSVSVERARAPRPVGEGNARSIVRALRRAPVTKIVAPKPAEVEEPVAEAAARSERESEASAVVERPTRREVRMRETSYERAEPREVTVREERAPVRRVIEAEEREPQRIEVRVAALPTNTAPVQPRPTILGTRILRKAALSDADLDESLRAARWRQATARVTKVVEALPAPQPLRVSLPSEASSPAAPTPRASRLLAENTDGDKGIDEMRSVVDDFRASLAPDESSSDTADSNF